jgi:hypothetical protein
MTAQIIGTYFTALCLLIGSGFIIIGVIVGCLFLRLPILMIFS